MSQQATEEFTGWRKLLWPIHSFEIKKFLPMGIMMFCILFIYTVLRDTKDAILVNAPGAGAESLAFAKGIGVTISAVLFMILYTKAANVFKREGLFYVTALPFLIFFGLFPYFIYPHVETLHMNLETIQSLQASYPVFKWLIPLVGNWTYTTFYILSELWGSAVLSLLFWAFANAITPVKQSRRFYGMFGFVGNFGLLMSGPAIILVSQWIHSLGLSRFESTGLMLKVLMAFVIAAGVLLIGTFYWMNRAVLTDIRHYNPEEMERQKEESQAFHDGQLQAYPPIPIPRLHRDARTCLRCLHQPLRGSLERTNQDRLPERGRIQPGYGRTLYPYGWYCGGVDACRKQLATSV
jgi:AAA family ATP:ADP antiporter